MGRGLSTQDSQRAGGLGRERDPSAVEPVPDDLHGVGMAVPVGRRKQQVGGVDLEAVEFKGRVVGMLERMERVVPQSEAVGIRVGEPREGHGRTAVEQGEHFYEPAVGGPRDEHLRAGEQQAVSGALDHGADGGKIAPRARLRGTEDRQRSALRKAGQVAGLLVGRAEGGQRTDRADRRMHREHARRGGRVRRHPGDRGGEFLHRATGAAERFGYGQPPEADRAERLLGGAGKNSPWRRRRVGDRRRWQVVGIREWIIARGVEPQAVDRAVGLLENRGHGRPRRRGGAGCCVGKATGRVTGAPEHRGDVAGLAGVAGAHGFTLPRAWLRRFMLHRVVSPRVGLAGSLFHRYGGEPLRGLVGGGRVEHPLEMVRDRVAFELERRRCLAVGGIERPADEHRPPHPPGPWQAPLPPREPPREPLQNFWMPERLSAAEHPQPQPPDRPPQHVGLGHDDRHRPRQPVADHADLRDRGILREHPLHLGWR